MYYISTYSTHSAPCFIIPNNDSTNNIYYPSKLDNYVHKDDYVVSCNAGVIYINHLKAQGNIIIAKVISADIIDKYFNKINETSILENHYAGINGNIYESNSYNIYKLTPSKNKIYLIYSISNYGAPLICQKNNYYIPKNIDNQGVRYYNGFNLYFPNYDNDILINLNKHYSNQVPIIYESKFDIPNFNDNKFYNYAIGRTKNLVCIGDSLTQGATYFKDNWYNNFYSFPYFLGKLLSCDNVYNEGWGGGTSTSIWNSHIKEKSLPDNTLYTVWIGANNEFTDTIEVDCNDNDYNNYNDTMTGNMGKILGKIASGNNNAIIIINNCIGSHIEINNTVLKKFADKFNALYVDIYTNTDIMNDNYHTSYDNNINAHFNDAGHNYVANIVFNALNNKLKENPLFLNFNERLSNPRVDTNPNRLP